LRKVQKAFYLFAIVLIDNFLLKLKFFAKLKEALQVIWGNLLSTRLLKTLLRE